MLHELMKFHVRLRLSVFLLVTIVVLLLPVRSQGQAQSTGTLAGNVVDSAHQLIPDAVITLTSDDRGNVLKGKSNAKGEYVFNDLMIGSYTLTVTAPTFSTFVSRHIAIDGDTRLRLDAELKPGSVDSQVEVNADSQSVDTQSATVGEVIDNELVENLPIDGNNVVSLAALLPGVTDVSAPTTFTDENGGATFSANGSRGQSNLFLFDGLLWNNLYLNTGINYPNHAVLQQVSVQLNNFSAQYGRNAGSIFNVNSKSGTNTVHGELFLSYRDAIFDAQNYFARNKPPLHTYQYGAAVGGAIKRDKLFYEAEYQSLTGTTSLQGNATTLSQAERGLNPDGSPRACVSAAFAGMDCASFVGDAKTGINPNYLAYNPVRSFSVPTGATVNGGAVSSGATQATTAISQLNSTYVATGHTLATGGNSPCVTLLQSLPLTIVTIPTTATSTATTQNDYFLPNAEVPAICLDPTTQAVINHGYIPLPDTQLAGSQFLYSSAQTVKPQTEYGGFLRMDYNLSSRQIIDARFYRTNNADTGANGATNPNTAVPSFNVDANAALVTAGSIGHTFVLSANKVNVARLGYKRYDYNVVPLDRTTLSTLGSVYSYPGFPSLSTININTRFTLGSSLSAKTHSVSENIEFIDNLSISKGAHNIQIGTDYLRLQYYNNRVNPGTFNFYGNPGFTNLQGADFIMGLIYSESLGNPQTIAAIQHADYSYIQDTWRATPRLTLSLGVRYELPFMWYQPDSQAATFIRGYQSTVFANAPANFAFVGDQGVSRSLVKTDYTNISPRVGIAYDVFGNGKTAIRGGFGTFYDAIPATIVGLSNPFTFRETITYPAGSFTDPLLGLTPIPTGYTPGSATFPTPYSITFPDKNFKNAYTIGVNFGVQQQVGKGNILEANYLGRFSRHQLIPIDLNPTIFDPTCSGANYKTGVTTGTYCAQTPTSNYNQRATFPGFGVGGGGVVDLLPEATANYNALQVTVRSRNVKNITALANYTYSRTIDEQSTLATGTSDPLPSSTAYQYAASNQNTTHIFNFGARMKFPNFQRSSFLVKNFAGGWAINAIYNARTGHPVNLTFGGDIYGNDEPSQRPYLNPGYSATLPSNRHRRDKINAWFNNDPNAFRKPDNFTLGNVGRNSIIGPAYINTTMSLTKEIQLRRLREGTHAQFRAEAFNLFNTVNLGQPNSNLNTATGQTSTFGTITSGGSNVNRTMQFGLFIYF